MTPVQVHGSCVALHGAGVLLTGPPGAGKSDLALRLIDRGFMLVADDRVEILDGVATCPGQLRGLLEVRGLGICRFPHADHARLALHVRLGETPERLPAPETGPHGLPTIALDPFAASAPQRVALALALATGHATQLAGAFRP